MTDLVTVIEPPDQITTTLAIGQGPAGPPGSVGGQFQFTQASPSAVWTVNHNLGFRPNVALTTLGGAEVWGEVLHVSANQVLVTFDGPIAGLALCS